MTNAAEAVSKMKQDVSTLMQGGESLPKSNQPDSEPAPQKSEPNESTRNASPNADRSNGADSSDGGDNDNTQPQLSDRQQREMDKAIQSGWKPQDKFKGDSDDFVAPREWNRTVALYRRLDRESERSRKLEKEVGSFGDRVKNVMEIAKKTAIAELEAKKQAAVEEADYKEVQRIDSEIKKTDEDFTVEAPEVNAEPTIRPEVEDWMSDNDWFDKEQGMTQFALSFQAAQLGMLKDPQNPSAEELRESLKKTTRAVRNEYPDHFQRKPRNQAPSMEGGGIKPKGKKFGYSDLTDQEKTVLKEVERLGGMKKEDYIQAIADMRGAK